MTPEQALVVLKEVYIPQIQNEQKTTARVLGAVPADKLEYTPDPKSMNAWKLAAHIASADMFFMLGAAAGNFDRANGALPETVKTPADLVKWYDQEHPKAVAKIATMSGDDLLKTINFAGVFNFPAMTYLGLMLSHGIHHRGQLSAYLRPMGAKVPRIYGGSADEPIEATQGA